MVLFAPFCYWYREQLEAGEPSAGALTQPVDGARYVKFSDCSANVLGCTKRFALLLTQSAEVTGKAAPWVLSCQKFPERVIQPTYVCR